MKLRDSIIIVVVAAGTLAASLEARGQMFSAATLLPPGAAGPQTSPPGTPAANRSASAAVYPNTQTAYPAAVPEYVPSSYPYPPAYSYPTHAYPNPNHAAIPASPHAAPRPALANPAGHPAGLGTPAISAAYPVGGAAANRYFSQQFIPPVQQPVAQNGGQQMVMQQPVWPLPSRYSAVAASDPWQHQANTVVGGVNAQPAYGSSVRHYVNELLWDDLSSPGTQGMWPEQYGTSCGTPACGSHWGPGGNWPMNSTCGNGLPSCGPGYNWYAGGGGLLLTRDSGKYVRMSVDSNAASQTILSTRDVDIDWNAGYEVRLGRVVDCGTRAVEVVWWSYDPGLQSAYAYWNQVSGTLDSPLDFSEIDATDGVSSVPIDLFFDDAEMHRVRHDFQVSNLELDAALGGVREWAWPSC